MNIRFLCYRHVAIHVALVLSLAYSHGIAANASPNVLFILADDMGYADIGSFGGDIATPNLDTLAENGIRFSNFYAAPVCSPTRAMLMSGNDAHLVGLGRMEELEPMAHQKGRDGYEGYLRSDVSTLPELLRDAGYTTLMAGKWHLGREQDQSPSARGFDRAFALTTGYSSHYGNPTVTPLPILDRTAPGPQYRENGKGIYDLPENFYSSNYFTEKLLNYLEEHKNDNKPFFAYLAFTAPHWPLQAPKAYIEKYRGKYDAGYDALRQQKFERLKHLGLIDKNLSLPPTAPHIPPWKSLSADEKARQARMMETYAGMIDNMDANIGRVIGYLKRSGQYENTMIVFMSDNGADSSTEGKTWLASTIKHYDNSLESIGSRESFVVYGAGWARARASTPHLREFKGASFEGGIRVPAIVKMPGARNGGAINDALLTVEDWLPTLAELTGTKVPYRERGQTNSGLTQGRSFLPLLREQNNKSGRTHAAWELNDSRALRIGHWKIVYVTDRYAKRLGIPTGWKLYNLKNDPGEQSDLSKAHPEKLSELHDAWLRYAADNNIHLP